MRRAWIVLLVGCGFQGPRLDPVDAGADPDAPDANLGSNCWQIIDPSSEFRISACVMTLDAAIDLRQSVSIDTDGASTNTLGLTCAVLERGSTDLCALAASSIKIPPGVTVSARGKRPLAFLGHALDIGGTIDVASHVRGQRAPAAEPSGCNPGPPAKGAGGGAGGRFDLTGGRGGEQGGATNTGGRPGSSISPDNFRGGCDGGRGGNGADDGGPAGPGGAGGGAVWIASAGTLVLAPGAIINASGASGTGGLAGTHGGAGGGSGGHIVLQAPTLALHATALIFANGGAGGGGSQGSGPGGDGIDPTNPTSGGVGGNGGPLSAATPPGGGGAGYPDPAPDGAPGSNTSIPVGGGGGGGGGPGVIHVDSPTSIAGPNVSPPPLQVSH